MTPCRAGVITGFKQQGKGGTTLAWEEERAHYEKSFTIIRAPRSRNRTLVGKPDSLRSLH